jgi:methenyltetrahydromethanopterin cyclohydrolase
MKSSPWLQLLQASATQLSEITRSETGRLGITVHAIAGAEVWDFAGNGPGGKGLGTLAGGLRLAEICLGGLGQVRIDSSSDRSQPNSQRFPQVSVCTDFPLPACIGSQYAGWAFSADDFFAMCSGTVRINYGREPILKKYRLTEFFPRPVAILECNRLPDETAVLAMAEQAGVRPADLLICLAPTASLPGSLQVVARSVETAMHKLHEIGFDLECIRSAIGSAPLPPIPPKDLTALGWTNDAILYGGSVSLWVECEDAQIEQMLATVPSCSSRDYGKPFLEIFEHYNRDFYLIDKLLFSPAEITFFNHRTGRTFRSGQLRLDLLAEQWEGRN